MSSHSKSKMPPRTPPRKVINRDIARGMIGDDSSPVPPPRESRSVFGAVILPPMMRSAILDPSRAVECSAWVKARADEARRWRGENGETLMHWAFLNAWSFALAAREAGLDFNDKDNLGRTPMDWLNDRLWQSCVKPQGAAVSLSTGGRERLRRHTEDQILRLWPLGARPGSSASEFHPGVVWTRAGAWDLLELLNLYPVSGEQPVAVELIIPETEKTDKAGEAEDRVHHGGKKVDAPSVRAFEGSEKSPKTKKETPVRTVDGWMNWTPVGGSALHAWVVSPNSHRKTQFLKTWMERTQNPDPRDDAGRTPLWYAVDAWISVQETEEEKTWSKLLLSTIKLLLNEGADANAGDGDNVSPSGLASRALDQTSWEAREIRQLLDLPVGVPA